MTKPKLLIDADDGCDDFPYQPVARNPNATVVSVNASFF